MTCPLTTASYVGTRQIQCRRQHGHSLGLLQGRLTVWLGPRGGALGSPCHPSTPQMKPRRSKEGAGEVLGMVASKHLSDASPTRLSGQVPGPAVSETWPHVPFLPLECQEFLTFRPQVLYQTSDPGIHVHPPGARTSSRCHLREEPVGVKDGWSRPVALRSRRWGRVSEFSASPRTQRASPLSPVSRFLLIR